jgi:2-hydroxy-3-keto-5-methylthiopentenyl-1-phosphate phosphatase
MPGVMFERRVSSSLHAKVKNNNIAQFQFVTTRHFLVGRRREAAAAYGYGHQGRNRRSSRNRVTRAMGNEDGKVFVWGLDFDSTITENDTVKFIVKAAMQDNREAFEALSKASSTSSEDDIKWKNIQLNYLAKYEKFLESVPMSNITTFCEAQRVFDRKMNAYFASTGLLKGTRKETLRHFARQVPLRPGAHLLLSEMLAGSVNPKPGKTRMEVHVVSCCWSQTFLRAALNVPSHLDGALRIHCNDLDWNADGVCAEGEMNFSVQDPLDKSTLMGEICEEYSRNASPKTNVSSVFVGDSPGDIHAMVKADVGLLMDANVSGRFLLDVCKKCGNKFIGDVSGKSLTDLAKES